VASGRFAEIRSAEERYDHFFGFRGEAVDSQINGRQQHDLWDQDIEVHQVGYLTDQLFDGIPPEKIRSNRSKVGFGAPAETRSGHDRLERADAGHSRAASFVSVLTLA
jgi:hypothetical protein